MRREAGEGGAAQKGRGERRSDAPVRAAARPAAQPAPRAPAPGGALADAFARAGLKQPPRR
jgi:hypothetical protein